MSDAIGPRVKDVHDIRSGSELSLPSLREFHARCVKFTLFLRPGKPKNRQRKAKG